MVRPDWFRKGTHEPHRFTIGYEHARSDAVLDELVRAGVELLIDVRAVAASRRPGFSKRALAAGLDERGIAYLHLRGLGTPAAGRQAARAGRPQEMLRIYETHLATDQAQVELAELRTLVRSGRPVCLLCYERHPEGCHRSRLTELFCNDPGAETVHLFAPPI